MVLRRHNGMRLRCLGRNDVRRRYRIGVHPWCRAGEGVPGVTAGLIAVAVPGMEMSR